MLIFEYKQQSFSTSMDWWGWYTTYYSSLSNFMWVAHVHGDKKDGKIELLN
jgi:hypothetical protein